MRAVLFLLILMSLRLTPLTAQNKWPEWCVMPNLEDVFGRAGEARTRGDMIAFLEAQGEIARNMNRAQKRCLEDAIQTDMPLEGLSLGMADLDGANLTGANLPGAILWEADLEGAALVGANLKGADLTSTVLEGARLDGANLDNVGLSGATLDGADLREARLQGAYLGTEYGQNYILRAASLRRANLTGANLQGADLRDADLLGANLDAVLFDENTILPDGTNWTTSTNMRRFTDLSYPEFWYTNVTSWYGQ